MKHRPTVLIAALGASLASAPPLLASDAILTFQGTVSSAGVAFSAPVGSTAELELRVSLSGTVAPAGRRSYVVDPAAGFLRLASSTYAFESAATMEVVDGPLGLPDSISVKGVLAASSGYWAMRADVGAGTFSSNELTALVGSYALAGGVSTPRLFAVGNDVTPTTPVIVDWTSLDVSLAGTPLGVNYCVAAANSALLTGAISATGSPPDPLITLSVSNLPADRFGYFLVSQERDFVMNPAGSRGHLCLGGAIGRYVSAGQIKNSGTTGSFSLQVDTGVTPTPTGPVAIQPGETWNFQCWYRDLDTGPTSNFTDGIEITF